MIVNKKQCKGPTDCGVTDSGGHVPPPVLVKIQLPIISMQIILLYHRLIIISMRDMTDTHHRCPGHVSTPRAPASLRRRLALTVRISET